MSAEAVLLQAFLGVGFQPSRARGVTAFHRGWMLFLGKQVRFGEYRADFVIGCATASDSEPPPFKIIVEVDGPEHDDRKRSALDRRRDRFFALNAFHVVRFTNEEVFADPYRCAQEVLELAIALQEPRLDALFTRHLERAS